MIFFKFNSFCLSTCRLGPEFRIRILSAYYYDSLRIYLHWCRVCGSWCRYFNLEGCPQHYKILESLVIYLNCARCSTIQICSRAVLPQLSDLGWQTFLETSEFLPAATGESHLYIEKQSTQRWLRMYKNDLTFMSFFWIHSFLNDYSLCASHYRYHVLSLTRG